MMKRLLFLSVFLLSLSASKAQQNIGVGKWRSHLPQKEPQNMVFAGNYLYGWTNFGFARYDLVNNETEALSKIEGFTEVGLSDADYSKDFSTLVIAYQNSNIDLLTDAGEIYNVPDL